MVAYATDSPILGQMPPVEQLRAEVQRFVRGFGLLASDKTPCGTPITTSHAHALMVLLEHARALELPTQQQLGAALGIDKSNVARLCAKLERSGELEQRRSALDRRARLLVLTELGRRRAERVETASRERFSRILELLPSDERRGQVLEALKALNGAIARAAAKEQSSS